ncbi:MAG: SpoIIE family protein phosphatase, partial [Candidatus Acidiferrales bacterium]
EIRKARLRSSINGPAQTQAIAKLIREVDSALDRISKGTYGICETCNEGIEKDRLLADPLMQYCVDHLTADQRHALQDDLDLASKIQRALLPPGRFRAAGYQAHYFYQPMGAVSGDYCDLIPHENGGADLFFAIGDVSGKGVAASMLMTHLHAMFRSLATVGFPLDQLLSKANRVFCESTLAGQFATLVCGRARHTGEVEISGAGHPPVLHVRKNGASAIESSGVPLGMFCDAQFGVQRIAMDPGDCLVLYTDGISETRNPAGIEYGTHNLSKLVSAKHGTAPEALAAACLEELKAYSSGTPQFDDRTLLIIHRA